MAHARVATWLLDSVKSFRVATGGNVMLTFGLAIVPIVGFVGAAIDYSRANSVKSAMQAASDATALMLAKDVQSLDSAKLNQRASDFFMALFTRPETTSIIVTPNFAGLQEGSFKLQLEVSGKVPTTFTKVFGQPELNVNVKSEVVWGMRKLEIAMALDNTGSMASSNKMTHLKIAAHNLLSTLKKAAKTNGDVKVAIIPFDTSVNLGTSYAGNNWFDYDSLKCGNSSCTSNNWKNYWQGCVRDRTYPYDVQDDPPTNNNTFYPVDKCGSLVTLMPLNYDWAALNEKIEAMSLAQRHYQRHHRSSVGVARIDDPAPLSEAAALSPDLDKVIILLTDGNNTESWKNSNNTEVTNQSAIDARTALVCQNIKAANIKLYTIRVIDGNSSLLKSCASNSSMYYNVQQAGQLNDTFELIAQSLARVHISK